MVCVQRRQHNNLELTTVSPCSVSEGVDAKPPPGLSGSQRPKGSSNPPPGLSQASQPPAARGSSAGRANAADNTSSSGAASDAATSAADVLQNSGASAPPASQDNEKQLRNLRKKIRQADATAQKAAEGKQLTPEEQEKLQKLKSWYALPCHVCNKSSPSSKFALQGAF